MHQLGSEILFSLPFALAAAMALIALPLAIVITLALNRLFRSRVEKSMKTIGGAALRSELHQPSANGRHGELEIERTAVTPKRAKAARATPLVAEARWQARRVAAIYAAAGCAYPLLLAAAFIVAIDFSPKRDLIVAYALFYGLLVSSSGRRCHWH